MTTRFTADDRDRANDTWSCNCAPSAVAAIYDLTLDEVRPYFTAVGFEHKRFTNPTMMYAVVDALGRPWRVRTMREDPLFWPRYGLARIQWEGRWMNPGVPAAARYKHTHWVASQVPGDGRIGIFDCNAMRATPTGTGWVGVADWQREIVPHILEGVRGASGAWHITHTIEIANH